MSQTKRRIKKDPHPSVETADQTPPRQTRVTLTRDVSSRYRKLVPRPQAGSAARFRRPPRPFGPANIPEERGSPKNPYRRRDASGHAPASSFEAMKDLVHRELPEAVRQLRETQDLLRDTAEQIMALLEDWAGRGEARPLITVLFEKMSFQDLAGQRLAKVDGFLKALGETLQPPVTDNRSRPRRLPKPSASPKPAAPEKSALKGPQAAGDGLGQDEVEALLADLFRQEGS